MTSLAAQVRYQLEELYSQPKGRVGQILQEGLLSVTLTNRVKHQLRSADEVILLHQMGKVGSKSVQAVLTQELGSHVFHTHLLNSEVRRELRAERRSGHWAPRYGWVESGVIGNWLKHRDPHQQLTVVSMTRDPVARNISAFFQTIKEFTTRSYKLAPGQGPYLREVFLAQFPHEVPLRWFDQEIRDVLGIDVFADPFPTDKGFSIYRAHNIKLLVLRVEDLNHAFGRATMETFGIPLPPPKVINQATDKRYRDQYLEFMQDLTLPPHYLDRMYGSRYSRHFYTATERKAFFDYWTAGGEV